MKYIRTKNGKIIDLKKLGCSKKVIDNPLASKDLKLYLDTYGHGEIIKQADTIEELCDEFMFIDEFFKREHRLAYSLENALARCKYHDVDITTLRGAIWTDKGLIYVAKMNDKGELELL